MHRLNSRLSSTSTPYVGEPPQSMPLHVAQEDGCGRGAQEALVRHLPPLKPAAQGTCSACQGCLMHHMPSLSLVHSPLSCRLIRPLASSIAPRPRSRVQAAGDGRRGRF